MKTIEQLTLFDDDQYDITINRTKLKNSVPHYDIIFNIDGINDYADKYNVSCQIVMKVLEEVITEHNLLCHPDG